MRSLRMLAGLVAMFLFLACDGLVGGVREPVAPDGGEPNSGVIDDDGGVDAGPHDAGLPLEVVFPLEVFGEPGHVVTTAVRVNQEGASSLRLRVNRPTWLEDGTYRDRGPKMAVRLDDGAWFRVQPQRVRDWPTWGTRDAGASLFPVEPANVTCLDDDGQFGGCLSGTYHTVRFSIPLASLGAAGVGTHTLSFRFEGTDGVSMGFRVLDLDLRTEAGASVLDRRGFREDDPDAWLPPFTDPASIAEGHRLWTEAGLLNSPIDPSPINAKCNSCHALDGRDLVFFNFSNYSIVKRSEFHGLSAEQGEKIASYLRTLELHLPGSRRSQLGRPWNPPYQPGPGLDGRPVALWTAGAGLDAVLSSDEEMGTYVVAGDGGARIASSPAPGGTPLGLLGGEGYLNPRETPQAIQLPDWNSWLPLVAPEDLTVDPRALFATDWLREYQAIGELLERDRDAYLYQDVAQHRQSQPNTFRLFLLSSGFPGDGRLADGGTGFVMTYKDSPLQLDWKRGTTTAETLAPSRAQVAMKTWRNLRKWELFHRYGLEQLPGWVQTLLHYESPPGMRVWPTANRDMFEIGPHFGGPGYPEKVLTFNDTPVGTYWTTVWYTLQQIVNGGYQAMAVTGPVDWNYQVPHIGGSARYENAWPRQPWRSFWGTQFMLQAIPEDSLITDFDWPLGHLGDAFGSTESDPASLARNDALARSFLTVVRRYALTDWPRKLGDGSFADDARFDVATTVPNQPVLEDALSSPYYGDVVAYECHFGHYANCYYLKLRRVHAAHAVSPAVLDEVLGWMKQLWPLYAWDAMRSGP